MLTALRASAKSWLAKLLIALLVVSFAIWGISDVFTGFGADTVAEAGDTEIDAVTFQRDYRNVVQRMSQQTGRGITPAQSRAMGLPRQVLGELVTEALLIDAADGFGVGVSDEALAAAIREMEPFQGPDGNFDRARFERLIAQAGYTEEAFLETERRRLVREQLASGLVGGVTAPEPWLRAVNAFQNEARTVAFVRLTRDAVGPIPDPTPSELQAFFEENRGDFQAPEYRAVSMIDLKPETLAEPETIPEEEVRRAYERSDAYGEPERRRVLQIVFDDSARAREALRRVEGDEAFTDVVADLGRSMADVDLGMVDRGEIVDPAVAEAAFAMDAGGTRLVDGRFGPVLVRVEAIEEARKRPFEQVEAELRRELAIERAAEEVVDLYDPIEDAFAGGATVREVADRFDLPLRTIEAIDRNGRTPDGEIVRDLPASNELLAGVFDTDVGVENAPIDVSRTHYVWYRVTDVIPARDRTLDEVRGEVVAAWTAERIRRELDSLADDVARRLRAGEDAAAIAEDLPGATAATTEPFSRADPSGRGDLPQAAVEAAFAGPQGHVADVVAGNGDHVVLEVVSVSQPAFFPGQADLVPIARELNRAIGDSLLTEYVATLQRERGVTVNQALIDRIVGGDV